MFNSLSPPISYWTCFFADSLQGLSEELLKPYMFMGTEVVYSKLHSSKEEATMTQVRNILRQEDMQANMWGDFVQEHKSTNQKQFFLIVSFY